MKRFLVLALLFVAASTHAQIVYKTDFEVATESMGIVYSITTQDVGECLFKYSTNTKGSSTAKCILNTFETAETGDRVQGFSILFGTSSFIKTANLNCSEIDDLIKAITLIKGDSSLRYISKTANLQIRGNDSKEKAVDGMIIIDTPTERSSPGDFDFAIYGYINPDDFIKLLQKVKETAD